jgi:hypothetical protein
LLRESGQFQSELMFAGPTDPLPGVSELQRAVGKEELRQLPGPCGCAALTIWVGGPVCGWQAITLPWQSRSQNLGAHAPDSDRALAEFG